MTHATELAEKPKIMSVHDLLAKMRAGTREVHEVRFREMVIPMRVLSVDEFNMIRHESYRICLEKGKSDETDLNLLKQKLVLKLASTIGKGGPLLSEHLLGMLSTDELNYIYDEYIRVSDIVNPNIDRMKPEEFKALVEAIKKNTVSVNDLSLPQLREIFSAYQDLIQRLAAQESPPGR